MLTLKSLPLALGLCLLSGNVLSSELHTPRAVVQYTDNVVVTANFATPVTGDLYLATDANNTIFFVTANGLSANPIPLYTAQLFSGQYTLFNTAAINVNSGVYPVYQVLTRVGGSPYNQADWIDGGIAKLNFTVNMPDAVGRDYNGDGFPDDDVNHTGFHDNTIKTGPIINNAPSNTTDNSSVDTGVNNSVSSTTDTPVTQPTPAPSTTTTTPVATTPTPTATTTPTATPPVVVAAPTPVVTTPTVSNTSTGQDLFNSNCGSCHGAPRAIRQASNASAIRSAINSNKGGMGMLKGISDADLAAIASYVSTH